MDLALLQSVHNYKEFLTVAQINRRLEQVVPKHALITLGHSDEGHPIKAAKLGNGKKQAIIFGFPHPNETVGPLTCFELIKLIKSIPYLQNEFTWYVIPCGDPDGAKLNEGWFKGRFSLKKYIYHFYRSKASLQLDWSFPFKYKNTEAIAKLIKKVKPDLIYPLHNAGFNGIYFYVSKPMRETYYRSVLNLAKALKLPLDHGEPEFQFVKKLKGPIFLDFTIKDYYEYYKRLGHDPKRFIDCGTDSVDFARTFNPNVLGLVAEVPYLYDKKLESNISSKHTRRTCITEGLDAAYETYEFIDDILHRDGVNTHSLFYDLLRSVVDEGKQHIKAVRVHIRAKSFAKTATKAEALSARAVTRFYAGLALGELHRLLLESPHAPSTYRRMTQQKINEFIAYFDKHTNMKAFDIKRLVQLQLGFLLISLDYLE